MRFEDVYTDWQERKLSCEDAGDLLGLSGRSFRRYCRRYEEEGIDGLLDKRIGKAAHNAAPVDEVMDMLNLYETRYRKYSTSHFYDEWRLNHKGTRHYNWVRKQLQQAGLTTKAKKKGKYKRRRERKPMVGMMIHQDGSTHEWIAGVKWDLIVTMDDANSEIYSAFFVEEEGTFSTFRGLEETITQKGLFCSFYTDRGAHYWTTNKANGKVDKDNLTQVGRAMEQVGRAMEQLGIEMIPAYSPEARGRSERMFGTLQKRLPNELTTANITDMQSANDYLKHVYLPKHNKRFCSEPQDNRSAFVPAHDNFEIKNILCVQNQRTVNKDNTVSYKGTMLQLPKDLCRYSYNKAKVKVCEYENGHMAIFYGPRLLAKYDHNSEIIENEKHKKSAASVAA